MSDEFSPIGTRQCPSLLGYATELDRCEHKRVRNIMKRLRKRDRTETAEQRNRRLSVKS